MDFYINDKQIDLCQFRFNILQFAVMSSSTIAKIDVIEESNKGFTKLILANPVPWRTRYLVFNVWHKPKLYHGDEAFKVGDTVGVEYRSGKFDRLLSMELVKAETCCVCYSLYERPPNTQTMYCGFCSIFDIDHRARAPTELKLIATTYKQCAFSKGCCITFVDEAADILYFAWTFEGKPHYVKFGTLETLRHYNISGWIVRKTSDGNYILDLTHIPTICE